MTPLLYAIGVVLLILGVSASIALHELGHLLPAKRFGVKVTRYMIGFGPTLFSFRRGETEYGVKALPLGGFIAMPGMYPPLEATRARAEELPAVLGAASVGASEIVEEDAQRRALGAVQSSAGEAHSDQPDQLDQSDRSAQSDQPRQPFRPRRAPRPRPFERTMADARSYSNDELGPGEEHRAFYALSTPKRLLIMFGGPAVNLLLGIGIMAIVLLGVGIVQPTTTVATVVECAIPASDAAQRTAAQRDECAPDDPRAPAWDIGLQPGDTVVSIDGAPVGTWDELSAAVGAAADTTVPIVIERDGAEITLDVPIIASERFVTDDRGVVELDDAGRPRTEVTGFLGVSPSQARMPMPVADFPAEMADMLGQTFRALITLPQKLVDIGQVAFTGAERDPEGPIGMVGVGRVAGEIASTDSLEIVDKAQVGLSLLGSLNLFLFAFNMVPLLPLDGGHIAVALYEGGRRRINLIRRRGRVGPFDTARLLPATYAVIGVLLAMTALLLYVDIVAPVVLFG